VARGHVALSGMRRGLPR